MITGRSVVCFSGTDWWYHNPHSRTHIMRTLARNGNRVLFVNSLSTRLPKLTERSGRTSVWKKLRSYRKGAVCVEKNLFVVTPLALPFFGSSVVRWMNKYLVAAQVRWCMRRFHLETPIVWLALPTALEAAQAIPHSLLLYQAADKISAYRGIDKAVITELELRCFGEADLVMFPGQEMFGRYGHLNKRSYLLEHGVDYEHFSQAAGEGVEPPEDIATIPGPIVGYFGEVDYKKVDQALIRHAALARPSWSFVFIGNVSTDISNLDDLPNVYFLGARSYESLPAYAKAFDVCAVPWDREDEMVRHASPIKIREYLATGRPVVSTDFPEAHTFASLIRIARDRDDFVPQIEAALEENKGLRQLRMDAVKGESWESRVEEVSARIAAAEVTRPVMTAAEMMPRQQEG